MLDLSKCQYCFLDYDSCTCCKYCGQPKECECRLEGEFPCTKPHPSDIYKVFNLDPNLCLYWMQFSSVEDLDKHVMKMFTPDSWPERLKEVIKMDSPILVVSPQDTTCRIVWNWVSVKEKLPKDRETVLWVYDLLLRNKYKNMYDGPSQIVGYYIEEINSVCLVDLDEYDQFFRLDEFTHWMPLPTPPEE